ncbi:hydroxymethylbilane synthase [Halobacteriales archaeon SW_5_70_135]|nr:MAG: hydroxymethylbilane synthase [Halobacteriales archaeon SW_5_70_135]
MTDRVRLATRGSDLALRQTRSVARELERRRFDVELVEVTTRGDELRDELVHRLGRTGAFVRALDEEVLDDDGAADAAVHSMKDMPTESPPELVVAAVPERAAAGDVLVTPDGHGLDDLPEGATVGTASVRRRAQLLARRDDLDVEPLRGNVDTRIEKLLAPHLQREHERRLAAEDGDADIDTDNKSADADTDTGTGDESASTDTDANADTDADTGDGDGDPENLPDYDRGVDEWFDDRTEIERRALGREVDREYDAVVLAEAGLDRIGLLGQVPHQRLPPGEFVPSPGQGALAVVAREGEFAAAVHDAVDHPRTRVETTVERTVLAVLGGGCVAPIGVHALLQGEVVRTTVAVHGADGRRTVRDTRDLDVQRHAEAAREFAADLADRGAADLVADAVDAGDSDGTDPDSDATSGAEDRS